MKKLISLILAFFLITGCATQEGGENMANYLYNGVELPDINSVWDKETYPYAYITEIVTLSGEYRLAITSEPLYQDGTTIRHTAANTAFKMYHINDDDGVWSLLYSSSSPPSNVAGIGFADNSVAIWTNADMNDANGNLFLAASDPVYSGSKLKSAVGASKTLTWNASDGYLETDVIYKVFDATPTYDELYFGKLTMSDTSGASGTIPLAEDGAISKQNGMLVICSLLYVVPTDVAANAGIPSGGVWVIDDLTAHGLASLSLTYLDASGGVTSTTADVTFACDSLLYTDSVYRIKAWVYEPSGYKYNGVELPDINAVWTDKETYPYAILADYSSLTGTVGHHFLLCASSPFIYDGDAYSSDGSKYVTWSIVLDEGVWTLLDSGDNTGQDAGVGLLEPYWTSHDILNADGSVYLAASEPTPGGLDTTLPADFTSGLFGGPSHSETVTFTGLTPATDYAVYGVIFANEEATEHNATATFTTLAGEAVTELDFSNTELTIFDPNVTANAADFAISWTGLPVTDSDHVQYFISGELDDGTAATNSPFYLFSSDIAEDGEHELAFADLKPNTEYTLTARLLYNTTGEFSGFTDSGVEVTHTFTTLKDGGHDRDSFLLGMASGLGCTAATKADAEYNSWMQGYIVGEELRKALQ